MPPGPGRPKGLVNKTTALLKEAVLLAAELVGEDGKGKDGLVGFLQKQAAKENNAPFMALLARILPMQVAGEGEGPIKVIIQGADAGLL